MDAPINPPRAVYRLSKSRSWPNLIGVRPELVALAGAAILTSPVDFMVIEGLRTIERQKALVAKKASKTMNSRHITGHAIDVVPWVNGKVPWNRDYDERPWSALSQHFFRTAALLDIPVEWGGDWGSKGKGWDKPHWQLPRQIYPAD